MLYIQSETQLTLLPQQHPRSQHSMQTQYTGQRQQLSTLILDQEIDISQDENNNSMRSHGIIDDGSEEDLFVQQDDILDDIELLVDIFIFIENSRWILKGFLW